MTPKSLGNPSLARCWDQSRADPCGSPAVSVHCLPNLSSILRMAARFRTPRRSPPRLGALCSCLKSSRCAAGSWLNGRSMHCLGIGRAQARSLDGSTRLPMTGTAPRWSSTEREMRFHAGQLEDYRRATGAARGLLVYMTPGVVRWVGALVGPVQAGG